MATGFESRWVSLDLNPSLANKDEVLVRLDGYHDKLLAVYSFVCISDELGGGVMIFPS